MDKTKASSYESLFKGRQIDRWTVSELIGFGKSAAVLRGVAEGKSYALKVFDTDLDERFGHEIQLKRVEQEISLKSHGIPNLIDIVDGGQFDQEGQVYHYIVMPHVEGKNLKHFIQTESYNQEFIVRTLTVLLDVTEKLLERSVAHRDIKPENIIVTPDGEIVLMDLGVLKLMGTRSFTDEEQKQFIGTLRYAPPEFLLREEQDSPNGWRAINLYQIGGVLHDLIMKRELFADVSPYPQLVLAIKERNPEIIANAGTDGRLLSLARNLLAKNWQQRLSFAPINQVRGILASVGIEPVGAEAYYQKAQEIRSRTRTSFDELEGIRTDAKEKDGILANLQQQLDQAILASFKRVMPQFGLKNLALLGQAPIGDSPPKGRFEVRGTPLFRLDGGIHDGFLRPFFVLMKTAVDYERSCFVGALAILPSRFVDLAQIKPSDVPLAVGLTLFAQLERELNPVQAPFQVPGGRRSSGIRLFFHRLFLGVAEFDSTLDNVLDEGLSRLVLQVQEKWQPFVRSEIENQKAEAVGKYPSPTTWDKSTLIPSSEQEAF